MSLKMFASGSSFKKTEYFNEIWESWCAQKAPKTKKTSAMHYNSNIWLCFSCHVCSHVVDMVSHMPFPNTVEVKCTVYCTVSPWVCWRDYIFIAVMTSSHHNLQPYCSPTPQHKCFVINWNYMCGAFWNVYIFCALWLVLKWNGPSYWRLDVVISVERYFKKMCNFSRTFSVCHFSPFRPAVNVYIQQKG